MIAIDIEKRMHKQCVLIGILLLIMGSVTGCNQLNSDKEKFIGTWITEPKNNPMGGGNYTDTKTFYANGSFVTTSMGLGRIPGTWQLSNGKLIIDTYFPGAYRYRFSQNYSVLTLIAESSRFIENLTRQ